MSRRRKRKDLLHHDIPTKANRILHFIFIAIGLILIRVWYLAVIQHEQKLDDSRKPQQKVVIEPATRATIRDRFNLPLAINKISYQAAILYSELREIPAIGWKQDESGKKIKVFRRREYIKQLSELFGQILGLDSERVEDLIHAKASYYAQVPFVIKDEISEQEYYRLKMIEKDWPGVHTQIAPKRHYPRGRTAADLVGYMGAINRQEYEKILHEIKALRQLIENEEEGVVGALPEGIESIAQAQDRLDNLEEKAYTIHDYVGKLGVEGKFEELLRGYYGKKKYYSNSKGNFLWELPGSRSSLPGHRILLTISAELQEYAERLLAQNEEIRIVRQSRLGLAKKTVIAKKTPWLKGGAIVVMDPNNGEILTMASFPRFDPNDFITSGREEEKREKTRRINRWFENESYIEQIWDQQSPFERERFNVHEGKFNDEEIWLTWPAYLTFTLPEGSDLRKKMDQFNTIGEAILLQRNIQSLMNLFPNHSLYTLINMFYQDGFHKTHKPITKMTEKSQLLSEWESNQEATLLIKKELDPYFSNLSKNYDKVLFADLAQLAVNADAFKDELLTHTQGITCQTYHQASGSLATLTRVVEGMAKELFREVEFKKWRKEHEKEFIKQKRIEEKLNKKYPKPYLDYFDQYENQLFKEFWSEHKWDLIGVFLLGERYTVSENLNEKRLYVDHFVRWNQELNHGAHGALDWNDSYRFLTSSIQSFPEKIAMEFLQTLRHYQQLNRPLYGRYRGLRNQANPLEKHLAASFYPLYGFGYGRSHAFRQATIQGSLFKIVTSYAALIQRYKQFNNPNISLEDLNPLVMSDQEFMKGSTRYLGYAEDGKPIAQLYKGGRLPRSLAHRNTGKVDLIKALEVSSNPYFALLAGDHLERPEDLAKVAEDFGFGKKSGIQLTGEIPGKVPDDLASNRTGLYSMAIGQHSLVVTPLQTAVMLCALANKGKILMPKIIRLTVGAEPTRGDDQLQLSSQVPRFSGDSVVHRTPTIVKKDLLMPDAVQKIILKGLDACVKRTYQENLYSLTKLYKQHPEAIMQFTSLKDQLVGKSSTSESVENIDLDLDEGTGIYTHVWFGCISSEEEKGKKTFLFKDEFGNPELVVVVYLRYGGYGKEAAPLAAQIVKRWREIKAANSAVES